MKGTVSKKTGRTYAGTTINKLVSLARRIFYLAMDEGIVRNNPFARRGQFKEHPKGKYIPDQDFRMIYAELPQHVQPIALTAYLTGMRASEIITLTWDKVDLENGTVDLGAEDTKTNEPRVIYLNRLPELRRVFVEARLRKRTRQKLVFTRPDGTPNQKWSVGGYFKRVSVRLGLGPYRFHDLRHTFNTNMVKAGVDRSVVMRLTGHKTLSMFLRYSHLDREQSEEAMESLGALLEKKRVEAHG